MKKEIMKNQHFLKRISTSGKLTVTAQTDWRMRLKDLAGLTGIYSICLDDTEIFIEYDPLIQNREFIGSVLKRIGFPVKQLALVPVQ